MNIDSIGKNNGPNYLNINLTKKLYPSSKIVVSGGIRDNKDIKKIKKFNCSEVILLSSIIKKNIVYSDL
jgi:phosphoribosylformimino-5-aminoimidazole carboxamide ribonucleotide (ProFAR) isomerase